MSRFIAIPAVPLAGLPEWKIRTYSALKQNIELLIAQRGESDRQSESILEGTFNPPTSVSGSILTSLTPPLASAPDLNTETGYWVPNPGAPTTTLFTYFIQQDANWTNFELSTSYRATGTSVRSLKEDVAILHDRVTNLVAKLRS